MSDIKYSAITINRECGEFGHTIAGIVSKRLDLPFYDKDFVFKAAEASGYSPAPKAPTVATIIRNFSSKT